MNSQRVNFNKWGMNLFEEHYLLEIVQHYGALIEVGIGLGWFGVVSYAAHMAAKLLVGK